MSFHRAYIEHLFEQFSPDGQAVISVRPDCSELRSTSVVCGIAGYTHFNRRNDEGLIRRITQLLRHRGPDQQGVYVSQAISLGAVRLKIIDLDGGSQPIRSADGHTILVFNGEIYNYQELRQTLCGCGHRFESQSDTEVVLRAF